MYRNNNFKFTNVYIIIYFIITFFDYINFLITHVLTKETKLVFENNLSFYIVKHKHSFTLFRILLKSVKVTNKIQKKKKE